MSVLVSRFLIAVVIGIVGGVVFTAMGYVIHTPTLLLGVGSMLVLNLVPGDR